MAKPDLSALEHMPHLTPDSELAEQVVEKLEVPEKEADPEAEEVPVEVPIDFDFTGENGKPYTGQFKTRILSIQQHQQKHVLESQFNGGQPYDSINPLQAAVNHALAHMAFSLTKRPKWATSLRSLHDRNVVLALFEEVDAHAAKFLGRGQNQEASEETTE